MVVKKRPEYQSLQARQMTVMCLLMLHSRSPRQIHPPSRHPRIALQLLRLSQRMQRGVSKRSDQHQCHQTSSLKRQQQQQKQ